jgi:hypothetical protein
MVPPVDVIIPLPIGVVGIREVARILTGAIPLTVASRTWGPSTVPTVQAPGEATPEALVTAVALATDPPPESTVNATVTFGTAVPLALRTTTEGAVATAVPGAAT